MLLGRPTCLLLCCNSVWWKEAWTSLQWLTHVPWYSPPRTHHSPGLTLLFPHKFGKHELLSSDSEIQDVFAAEMDGHCGHFLLTCIVGQPRTYLLSSCWHVCLAHPWRTGVVPANVCGPWPCVCEAGPRESDGPLGTLPSLLHVEFLFCFYVFAVVVNITH